MDSPVKKTPRLSEVSVSEGLRELRYFLPNLKADLALVIGMVISSTLATFLRLPFIYLPVILTTHFQDYVAPERVGFSISDKFRAALLHFFPYGSGGIHYLNAAIVIAFLGILLLAPVQLLRSYLSSLVAGNQLYRLRVAIFKNIKRFSMVAVYEHGAGPFVQRLTRDMFILNDLLVHRLADAINLSLQILVYFTACMLTEPRLTLLSIAVYVAIQPILFRFNRRIHDQASEIQMLHEGITMQILESIGGYRDIMAGGHFGKVEERFTARSARMRRATIRSVLTSQTAELLLNITFGLLTVIPYFAFRGQLDTIEHVGFIITYVGLLSSLLPALAGLWGATIELSLARPSLRALRELLTPPPKSSVSAPAVKPALPARVERIRFEGVGLQMEGRWIVQDLNFEVRGGELSALIGESGSGKTTIFHLLLRLIEPTCGTIWINDVNLAHFAEEDLPRLMGFIPQNPFIFHDSIRENLLVATSNPEQMSSIDEITQAAQLEDLIRSRQGEGGIDASAGYLGMRLSGGERQRIALGRLLAQDPLVIVCDEYTANIDANTTKLIQNMMLTRFPDRLRLVITHELCNVRGVDKIFVLDKGRIVQTGTHEQLVTQDGMYRRMWDAQRLEETTNHEVRALEYLTPPAVANLPSSPDLRP